MKISYPLLYYICPVSESRLCNDHELLKTARKFYQSQLKAKSEKFSCKKAFAEISNKLVIIYSDDSSPQFIRDTKPKIRERISRIVELLCHKKVLAEQLFSLPEYDIAYSKTLVDLYEADLRTGAVIAVNRRGNVSLSENQIEVLAAIANKHSVFADEISAEQLRKFLYAELEGKVTIQKPIQKFGAFMSSLGLAKVLYGNWQTLIEMLKLVAYDAKFLKSQDISNMLQRARNFSSTYEEIQRSVAIVVGLNLSLS